jgi:DNA-binding NarL/FixJ family response regulator
MPGGGIPATARIREQLPEATVVMLTVSDEDGDPFDALRAGASEPQPAPRAALEATTKAVVGPRGALGRR